MARQWLRSDHAIGALVVSVKGAALDRDVVEVEGVVQPRSNPSGYKSK